MTASEARALSVQNQRTEFDRITSECLAMIEVMAKGGKFSMLYSDDRLPEAFTAVEAYLQDLGYHVEKMQSSGRSINISW